MSEHRVASRYAKSLLELAGEKGVLKEVHEDMLFFSEVIKENREFELMLMSPVIKPDKKRTILDKIFSGKVNDLTIAIFDIVSRKNREPILSAIAREFHHQYNDHQGVKFAKVVTAVPLTPELRSSFKEMVKKISSMDKVTLIEEVDKDIIGGYILKVDDRQIDDSLKSKLKALELRFSQNPYIKEF